MKSFTTILALGSLGAAVAQVAPWGQCGGQGWTGQTTCQSGYCCNKTNEWYSQCVQGSCGGGGSSPTTTRAAAATTKTSAGNAAATTFCGQYDTATASNGYAIYNNLWGQSAATSGSQCTTFNGVSGSGVSWGTTWKWAGGQYNVKSYASAGKIFSPRLLSSISSIPSKFSFTYNVQSGTVADVALDLFTAADKNHVTYSGDYELMIWLAAYGGAGPISATGQPIATVTIAGQPWKLYYGPNGSMKVYSFVYANGVLNNFSADVKLFYNYLASSQGYPVNSQYLLALQGGTEPFVGGGTLQVSQFSATFN